MACASTLIPSHLHWNGRQKYTDADFQDEHCVYRLGNPIEFPSTITAYSCNWSFLIEEKDVLLTQDPIKHDDYRYAKVIDLRSLKLRIEKNVDDSYLGWHIITCYFQHSPNDCNYSHSEININHKIFEDELETNLLHNFKYGYNDWKKSILNGKSLWFTQLKYNYITEIIKRFCYPLPFP